MRSPDYEVTLPASCLGNDFFLVLPFASLISTVSLSVLTSMIASGHIIAHIAQPVHSPSLHSAGKYPFLLETSEARIVFFGQTTIHRPQPLHRSVSIFIIPAICRQIVAMPGCIVKPKAPAVTGPVLVAMGDTRQNIKVGSVFILVYLSHPAKIF